MRSSDQRPAAWAAPAALATSDNADNRRAGVATLPPALAHGFRPAGAFDLALGANVSGDVALTFVLDRRLPAPLMIAIEELGTFVNRETRAAAALRRRRCATASRRSSPS